MSVISQSGLYALILRSNKPEAKKFRKWITSEVIPSIMKSGTYSTRGRRAMLPENTDKIIKRAHCFIVRVEIYESGKREYWQTDYNDPAKYQADITDLIMIRNYIEKQIKQIGGY